MQNWIKQTLNVRLCPQNGFKIVHCEKLYEMCNTHRSFQNCFAILASGMRVNSLSWSYRVQKSASALVRPTVSFSAFSAFIQTLSRPLCLFQLKGFSVVVSSDKNHWTGGLAGQQWHSSIKAQSEAWALQLTSSIWRIAFEGIIPLGRTELQIQQYLWWQRIDYQPTLKGTLNNSCNLNILASRWG